jgi:Flp pilus assembly protein TadD
MRTAILLAVFVPLAAAALGCARWQRHASKYQTVVGDPHRNETVAKKKSEQAAKAWQRGSLDRADQLLQEALIADVQYGPAHNNLGLLYYQTGRFYLAAWEFEYALKAMGDRPEPHNNLGMVFDAVDRNEDAIRCYAAARDLDATNPEYVGNLARALLKRNEHDPAARELLSELLL